MAINETIPNENIFDLSKMQETIKDFPILVIEEKNTKLADSLEYPVLGLLLTGEYPPKDKCNEIKIGSFNVRYLKKILNHLEESDKLEIWINLNKDKTISIHPARCRNFFIAPCVADGEEKIKVNKQ